MPAHPYAVVPLLFACAALPTWSQATPELMVTEIRIVSEGTEPRQLLRHQPPVADPHFATFQVRRQEQFEGLPVPASPDVAFAFLFETSAQRISTVEGNYKYKFSVLKAAPRAFTSVPTDQFKSMQSQIASMIGSVVNLTLNPLGACTGFAYIPPPRANVELSEALPESLLLFRSLALPMPLKPVGAGATWKARLSCFVNGQLNVFEATYTLDSIKNTEVKIQGTFDTPLDPAKFPSPYPALTKVQLEKATREGRLSLKFDTGSGQVQDAELTLVTRTSGKSLANLPAQAVAHEERLKLGYLTRSRMFRPEAVPPPK